MKHQSTAAHPPHAAPEKKKAAKTVKKDKDTSVSEPTHNGQGRDEVIRQTAYFIYEARNYENGHELDDWLQAEAQLASMPRQDAGGRDSAAQAA